MLASITTARRDEANHCAICITGPSHCMLAGSKFGQPCVTGVSNTQCSFNARSFLPDSRLADRPRLNVFPLPLKGRQFRPTPGELGRWCNFSIESKLIEIVVSIRIDCNYAACPWRFI